MATTQTTHPVDARGVRADDDTSSAAMIAILLVAAVLIIGLVLFALQVYPFAADNANVNLDVPNVEVPAVNPPGVDTNMQGEMPGA